jgi:hypothetical protein
LKSSTERRNGFGNTLKSSTDRIFGKAGSAKSFRQQRFGIVMTPKLFIWRRDSAPKIPIPAESTARIAIGSAKVRQRREPRIHYRLAL